VNKYAATPNIDGWTNTYAADGWAQNGNVYSITRYLDQPNNIYYTVYVTNVFLVASNGYFPIITSTGYVPALYSQGASPAMFAAGGVSSPATMARQVYVQTTKDPMFNFAVATSNQFDAHGFGVTINSFDSSNPNFSTNGLYIDSKAKDGGDVFSDGTFTNTINAGNSKIYGHAKTGPNGTVAVGPQGSVGSSSWVGGGTTGPEPGWTSTDLNVAFPDIPSPNLIYNYPTWFPSLPTGGNVNVGGTSTSFNSVVSSSGTSYYQVSSISGSIYVGTNANVVLWITGSVNNYNQVIDIAPGGTLTIYLAGSFSTAGNGALNNLSQNAANLYILGLPTCTSINLAGNAGFTGVIYAPEASLSLGGGGSDTYDFVGSVMARNITMNGHFNFHYDENLKNKGFAKGFVPSNWKESTH
jgi:hypothetical protein